LIALQDGVPVLRSRVVAAGRRRRPQSFFLDVCHPIQSCLTPTPLIHNEGLH
jgi:hypothetical protein